MNLVAGVEVSRERYDEIGFTVSNRYDPQTVEPDRTPRGRSLEACTIPFYTDVIQGKGRVYDATIDTVGMYLADTIQLVQAVDLQCRHPPR